MNRIIQFGEKVEGYDIPVLNEREIRAAAGILFLILFYSALNALYFNDFVLVKYTVTFFLIDLIIRVFINPKYAPTLIIGRFFVKDQTPEFVGAKQKKFAWVIGIVLSLIMFIYFVIVNVDSLITSIVCISCLIFLFFESVFGICLGCKLYPLIYKDKVQYCPGEVCDLKSKHEIQKISLAQLFVVLGFAALILTTVYMFNDVYHKIPYDLSNGGRYYEAE